MGIFLVSLAAGLLLLYLKKIISWTKKIVSKVPFFHKYLFEYLNSLLLLHKKYRKHLSAPLIDLLITFLSMVIIVIPSYIIFVSLDLNVNFMYLLFISSAAGFFSLVPFTLSGLGIREAFVIYLYSLINISPQLSLAMMLIFLLYRYSALLLLMLFFNIFTKKKQH